MKINRETEPTEVDLHKLTRISVEDFTVLSNVPTILKQRHKNTTSGDYVDMNDLL